MNQRERYLNVLKFKPADRIPLVEWPLRGATAAAWEPLGFPKGMTLQQFFGLDEYSLSVPINTSLIPVFESRVIEQNDRYKVWVDELGATRRDFIKQDTPGFVTRSWLKFPVENRADFLKMKERYNPNTHGRYPEGWERIAPVLSRSQVVTHLAIPSLFWTVRDWMGFENLCMAFYDQSALVEEMFEFLCEFYILTLQQGIRLVKIDMVELKEDMAYKHAPMISPAMFRKYMAPCYRRLIDFLKSRGVDIVFVDCDGYPGGLIPEWIETGIDGISPVEIAAGCNVLKIRKEYPRLAMWGGLDKRVLAGNREDVYKEVMSKVPAMLERGGFIPHIDHAIPADAILDNYIYFRELMEKAVHGL